MLEKLRIGHGDKFRIDDWDPDDASLAPGKKEETVAASEALEGRLDELQELLFAEHRHKLLVVLQGMDTSGKDGTVRHVMRGVSPASVRAFSFRKPTEVELAHDYLWRVHAAAPGAGEIAIFNRSHYEDVLVVRVHGLISEDVCRQRFDQIKEFERMLADNGTTILKFFLHIGKEEQRQRLQKRLDDPKKRWKFQHGDLDERRLWPEYMRAYEEAIGKTSTKWAPWTIVPANKKWYRNWVVAKVIVDALESLDMKLPQPDLSSERID